MSGIVYNLKMVENGYKKRVGLLTKSGKKGAKQKRKSEEFMILNTTSKHDHSQWLF